MQTSTDETMIPNYDNYIDIPTATEVFLKAAYSDLLEKKKFYKNANDQLKEDKEFKARELAALLLYRKQREAAQLIADSRLRNEILGLESDLKEIDCKIKDNSNFILKYYQNIKECNQVGKNIHVLSDFTNKMDTISNARNNLIKALEAEHNKTVTKSSLSEQSLEQSRAVVIEVTFFLLSALSLIAPFAVYGTPGFVLIAVFLWPTALLLLCVAVISLNTDRSIPHPIIDYTVKAKSGAIHVVSDKLSIDLERFNPSLDTEQDDALSQNKFVDTKAPVVTQAYLISSYGYLASHDASQSTRGETPDHDAQDAQPSAPPVDIGYFYPI